MKKLWLPLTLTVALASLAGCGDSSEPEGPSDDGTPVADDSPVEPQVEAGAPDYGDLPLSALLEVELPVGSVASHDDTVYVGTPSGLYTLQAGELAEVEVAEDDGTTVSAGDVAQMQKYEGGVAVVTAEGLFHTEGAWLLRSPVDAVVEDPAAVRWVDPSADGTETWLAGEMGLLRITSDAAEAFTFEGLGEAPEAVLAGDDVVLVADAGQVWELHRDDWSVTAGPAAMVTATARLDGWLLVGADEGLLARRSEGQWLLYPLADEGVAAVTGISVEDGAAVVATDVGVVEITVDGDTLAVAGLVEAAAVGVGLDWDGHVWTAGEAGLTQWLVGTPVSFAADLAPVLEAQCSYCHADGASAPKRDFADYDTVVTLADDVLQRTSLGLMPPPPIPAVSDDNLELLIRWYEGGMYP